MVTINNRDPRPVYEQVKEGFKRLIIAGVLSADEKMPSVRELAGQLAINPNTIQRAYAALEEEGYLTAEPGKGNFAAKAGAGDTARRDTLLAQLDATAAELIFLGMTTEELAERVSKAKTGKGGDEA